MTFQLAESTSAKQIAEWWKMLCSEEELNDVECSGKLVLLLSILADCDTRGDKVLVFSQSLHTLDLIEKFLASITQNTDKPDSNARYGGFTGQWQKNVDYFRLDGSTNIKTRIEHCKEFNNESNSRARFA